MPRARDPKRAEAFQIYKAKKGNVELTDIAKQLGISSGTIRGWKAKDKWEDKLNGTFPKDSERSNPKKNVGKKVLKDGTNETLKNEKLTPEQQFFCIYYVNEFNATQAYQKAYNCSYKNACSHAWEMWNNVEVCKEVERLKEIKRQQMHFSVDDIVELQIRIAFANMENYTSFGQREVPVWKEDKKGKFTPVLDPNTGQQKVNTYNILELKESQDVDMQLVKEVSEGKNGISIKLEDRQKAINWLTKYFDMMPMDKRKAEFDKRKLEIEMLRLELSNRDNTQEEEIEDDGFLDSLNETAKATWENENE